MLEGGCLCGALRYRISREPMATVVCHCTHCQKSSGGAFSVNLMVEEDAVALVGEASRYQDRGESGAAVYRCFCPKCGSPVLSILDAIPGVLAIKAGTLDDVSNVAPVSQVWRRSAHSWLARLNDLPAFETSPSR